MATFAPAVEVVGPIGFASPYFHYRLNHATPLPAVAIHNDIGFAAPFSHYRHYRIPGEPTTEINPSIGLATEFLRQPPRARIFQPTVFIDVVASPALPGDSGVEIVYNIPNHLRIRPHLIAPPNGSQHRLASPIMVWTPTIEAMYYEVHVARDIDFQDRVARIDSVSSMLQRGWPFGGTYYWRVRAVAGSAWSDYSEVWSFTVPEFDPDFIATHDGDGRDRLLNQFQENT